METPTSEDLGGQVEGSVKYHLGGQSDYPLTELGTDPLRLLRPDIGDVVAFHFSQGDGANAVSSLPYGKPCSATIGDGTLHPGLSINDFRSVALDLS